MCDTLCLRRPGGMLFAKSSDRPIDEPQVLRWFPRRPPDPGCPAVRTTYISIPDHGAAAMLGSQPTWMWGVEHGVNEHRVAIGNERVWTIDDPRPASPGLIGMDLVRLGLERGTSADETVDVITELLDAHGQGGSGEHGREEPYWSSFLVVDPGGGWIVETSGQSWVAAPVDAGAAISNRLTISTGWRRSSADVAAGSDWDRWRAPRAPTGIADHRLAATRRWLAGAAASPSAAAIEATGVLRDHGAGPWGAVGSAGPISALPGDVADDWSGVTVCMHVRDYQCTTASMIADLAEDPAAPLKVWASLGTPCTSVFLPVAMLGLGDAIVPSVLGDEAAWHAFAALSRAVERPGDEGRAALEAIRNALAPIEAAAWDEAEELWSQRAGAARWHEAVARWDADVRSEVAQLGQLP